MSKVAIAVTIGQAVVSIVNAIHYGREFYQQTVDFMDSMQIDSGLTGPAKKAAVMDKMREILLGKNEDWERWALALSGFIDRIKATYNDFKGLFPKLA
ncbi:hypothetical protein KTJ53_16135 [Acinetobacter variabilis]|uniref:hypothetical protein n=1 Tax=Acinetobacter variabilis TaxID=70346 RepID=UPI0021CFBDB1|nr:hypothetical protein [Acinetobacter variabilis]MCU4631164.1 hypothetical protein [Acinetobacter variabilis]